MIQQQKQSAAFLTIMITKANLLLQWHTSLSLTPVLQLTSEGALQTFQALRAQEPSFKLTYNTAMLANTPHRSKAKVKVATHGMRLLLLPGTISPVRRTQHKNCGGFNNFWRPSLGGHLDMATTCLGVKYIPQRNTTHFGGQILAFLGGWGSFMPQCNISTTL